MKKSIPKIRERESEAFILGNGREREFPLTPGIRRLKKYKANFMTVAVIRLIIWMKLYCPPGNYSA